MKKRLEFPFHHFGLGLAVALLVVGLGGCAGKKIIRSNGIHAIKLGDPLPAQGTDELGGVSVRDTLLTEREYEWRAALMEYEEGLVFLEEDFFGSKKLNRIRIETPELRLKNGLRVGKTIADLKSTKADWFIRAYPEFGVFEFYSRKFTQIHFLVETDQVPLERAGEKEYAVEEFGENDPIVGIVVF